MKRKFLVLAALAALFAFAAPAFAAMNPFMDVPASHWAYDAVAQLASRGVISGYPDGTYKGTRPTTRYEMASALARALSVIDMEKASKQDIEMLKRLVVEFKDELDALGVKVDKLDSRVAVFERDLGGWQLSGEFRFDAKFGNSEGWYGDAYDMVGKNHFDLDRYRIFLQKRINETTRFFARLGAGDRAGNGRALMEWQEYYIETRLGYDISMSAGVMEIDWEGDLGLYVDEDGFYAHFDPISAIRFEKSWGMADLQLVVGRVNDATGIAPETFADLDEAYEGAQNFEKFMVAGLVNFEFNERLRAGLMAHWFFGSGDERRYIDAATGREMEFDNDTFTVGVYAGYKFTPEVELKGIYYHQKLGSGLEEMSGSDKAKLWRVMLDVDQEALKFTSLWVEYGQMDNNFFRVWSSGAPYADMGADIFANIPYGRGTSKFYGASASQEWNDTWRTFVRYWSVDFDTEGLSRAHQWGLGVGYRLNPAVEFELAYDKIDYGTGNIGDSRNGDDHLVRFRTFVSF